MKLAPQPLRRNSRAKPALPNLSTCAQCASIASAISTFRTLSKNCRAVSVSPSKFFRYRSSDAKRHASKPFRINTCESVSKQSTLTTFRINTCEKPGGGGTTPGWYGPGTSLTEWTGSIPDTAELWQLRVKQAHAMENEQCYGRKTSLCL